MSEVKRLLEECAMTSWAIKYGDPYATEEVRKILTGHTVPQIKRLLKEFEAHLIAYYG